METTGSSFWDMVKRNEEWHDEREKSGMAEAIKCFSRPSEITKEEVEDLLKKPKFYTRHTGMGEYKIYNV